MATETATAVGLSPLAASKTDSYCRVTATEPRDDSARREMRAERELGEKIGDPWELVSPLAGGYILGAFVRIFYSLRRLKCYNHESLRRTVLHVRSRQVGVVGSVSRRSIAAPDLSQVSRYRAITHTRLLVFIMTSHLRNCSRARTSNFDSILQSQSLLCATFSS